MYKKYALCVIAFAFIIPQLDFRIWLDMFPELREIARCESNFNYQAIGDHGNSVGLFQIHLPSHPNITKEMALNPYFSISFAIDKYWKDELNIWTCAKVLTKN